MITERIYNTIIIKNNQNIFTKTNISSKKTYLMYLGNSKNFEYNYKKFEIYIICNIENILLYNSNITRIKIIKL